MPGPPHVFALSDDGELTYGSFHPSDQGYVFEARHSERLSDEIFGQGVLGAPLREPHLFADQLKDFLARLPAEVGEATLILPDSWLRLTFTEVAELPAKAQAQEEVLRFMLKRLVPFRVEDLRVSASEVTPFPAQQEPRRILLGFAIDLLVSQLEDAFAEAGVTIGQITNTTLAMLTSLERRIGTGLAALAAVHSNAYVLCFFRAGEPLLYRYKSLEDMPEDVQRRTVHRELRMTLSFVQEHFPDAALERVFLAAPEDREHQWLNWLGGEFGVIPEALGPEHFALARTQLGSSWPETAAMLGAAMIEVG